MKKDNLPKRDIMKCEDPCEYGRNRQILKGSGSLKTFEEQDNDRSRKKSTGPDDIGSIPDYPFEHEDLSISTKKVKENLAAESNDIGGFTLAYYQNREQEKIAKIIVHDPLELSPLRILGKTKHRSYKGRPSTLRCKILVA